MVKDWSSTQEALASIPSTTYTDMVVHTYNPSTTEAETEVCLEEGGFKVTLDYRASLGPPWVETLSQQHK